MTRKVRTNPQQNNVGEGWHKESWKHNTGWQNIQPIPVKTVLRIRGTAFWWVSSCNIIMRVVPMVSSSLHALDPISFSYSILLSMVKKAILVATVKYPFRIWLWTVPYLIKILLIYVFAVEPKCFSIGLQNIHFIKKMFLQTNKVNNFSFYCI